MTRRHIVKWGQEVKNVMSEPNQPKEASPFLTTGEIAKRCGVTVRTVQYYDQRHILTPSAQSEGGRRLYTEEDVKKLRLVTYLRSLELSLDHIVRVLSEDNAEKVVETIVAEQIRVLSGEIREKEARLREAKDFLAALRLRGDDSFESIRDMASVVSKKKEMRKIRGLLLAGGVAVDAVQIAALIYAVLTGRWPVFAAAMAAACAAALALTEWYRKRVLYICPECHRIFTAANRREFLFSRHTPKTRKLTCPGCGKKSFCVETAGEEEP
jgi:DNA-binding transcriptional MerR regulator/DNA-directed RNA polymerase subunit RPC12/RpoP